MLYEVRSGCVCSVISFCLFLHCDLVLAPLAIFIMLLYGSSCFKINPLKYQKMVLLIAVISYTPIYFTLVSDE